MSWVEFAGAALALAALPVVLCAVYLGALAAIARRRDEPARRYPTTRFDVLVPAHDEEAGIAATVASLRALDYPRALFRVIVIADNCADATAARASAAGALVLHRADASHRGKGYALAFGYEAVLADARADAVVVVDADTSVSPNLLSAFDAGIARGEVALQAEYGVRNPDASWRTRLVALGFTLFHDVRSVARERLRLSCGLRGNGMCFRMDVLRRVPHRAYSIVEDLEYGIQLGVAGIRVAYVGSARVLGDMPTTGASGRSQRQRWEGGRKAVAKQYAWLLLRAAAARRDRVALDLALDLMVPPLSRLVAATAFGWLAAAALAAASGANSALVALALWTVGALGLIVYVARGCAMSGGYRSALDLAWAPFYMLWKVTVRTRGSRSAAEWVRTNRADNATRGS